MYRNILVGFRNDPPGRDALALGRAFAEACDAEMIVAPSGFDRGRELSRIARREKSDLVVLGPTQRGPVGCLVPGATVSHLIGDAVCAVAVAPPGFSGSEGDHGWGPPGDPDPGPRVIGVGFDGSYPAGEALRAAAQLAVSSGAALRVYTVVPPSVHAPGTPEAGEAKVQGVPVDPNLLREALHEAVAELPAAARAVSAFVRGDPVGTLLEAASTGVDLMVLGSRAGGPIRRAAHGSVSDAIMRRARCPVLISPVGVTAPAPLPV